MKFTLEINLDNDAAQDPAELARMLRALSIGFGCWSDFRALDTAPVRDVNGNTVGQWSLTDD